MKNIQNHNVVAMFGCANTLTGILYIVISMVIMNGVNIVGKLLFEKMSRLDHLKPPPYICHRENVL